jgi:ubiquinone/menaquinone biosynthesis C-methylase UbiE
MLRITSPEGYYDALAGHYDSLYQDSLSQAENWFVTELLAQTLDQIPDHLEVLDIGCGTGLGVSFCDSYSRRSGRKYNYVGLDVSSKMIRQAKEKWKHKSNACFFHGDMCDLSYFADSSFNVICSFFGSFSHATLYGIAMSELYRILKPRGRVLLMVYSRYSLRNLFNCFLRLDKRAFAFKKPYNIRNEAQKNGCHAFFYSPNSLSTLLTGFGFDHIRFFGLNVLMELPIFKFFAQRSKRGIRDWLALESKLFRAWPGLGHSLIAIAKKQMVVSTGQIHMSGLVNEKVVRRGRVPQLHFEI